MVVALAKEALRIMQDTFPLHETISSSNAPPPAHHCLHSSRRITLRITSTFLVSRSFSLFRMASLLTLGYAKCMAVLVLVCRLRMGQNSTNRNGLAALLVRNISRKLL